MKQFFVSMTVCCPQHIACSLTWNNLDSLRFYFPPFIFMVFPRCFQPRQLVTGPCCSIFDLSPNLQHNKIFGEIQGLVHTHSCGILPPARKLLKRAANGNLKAIWPYQPPYPQHFLNSALQGIDRLTQVKVRASRFSVQQLETI